MFSFRSSPICAKPRSGRAGCLLISQHHAIITPILKKPSLDASVTSSSFKPHNHVEGGRAYGGRSDVGLSSIQCADAGIAVSIPTESLNGNCSVLHYFRLPVGGRHRFRLHCSASWSWARDSIQWIPESLFDDYRKRLALGARFWRGLCRFCRAEHSRWALTKQSKSLERYC